VLQAGGGTIEDLLERRILRHTSGGANLPESAGNPMAEGIVDLVEDAFAFSEYQ
jgi:hypothetical protein